MGASRSLQTRTGSWTISLQSMVAKNKELRHSQWLAAANWARRNTPEDAVFALKDAGLFSYFSDRTVMNLDGKASGHNYIQALQAGKVIERFTALGHQKERNPLR